MDAIFEISTSKLAKNNNKTEVSKKCVDQCYRCIIIKYWFKQSFFKVRAEVRLRFEIDEEYSVVRN
jgi:hypothetical protein